MTPIDQDRADHALVERPNGEVDGELGGPSFQADPVEALIGLSRYRAPLDPTDEPLAFKLGRTLIHLGAFLGDVGDLLQQQVLADISSEAGAIKKAAEEIKKSAEERRRRHNAIAGTKTDPDEKKEEQNLAKGAAAVVVKADETIKQADEAIKQSGKGGDPEKAKAALAAASKLLTVIDVRNAIRKIASADTDKVLDDKMRQLIGYDEAGGGKGVSDTTYRLLASQNLTKSGIDPNSGQSDGDTAAYNEKLQALIQLLKDLYALEKP